MKKEIKIRTAEKGDLDGILELDHRVWVDFPASREMIEARLDNFLEGNIVALDTGTGKVVGYLCMMFVSHTPAEFPSSWMSITGNGTMSTHVPNGEYMYGAAMTVDKGYSVGMELQVYGWAIAINYRKKGCYLGSPIPGFADYLRKHPGTTVDDYALKMKTRKGLPQDPELAYYHSAGFKAVRVLAEYEPDPKSLNYGVLIYCPNIFYTWPLRSFVAWLVKKFGFKLLKMLGV